MSLLGIFAIFGTLIQGIKEVTSRPVPAENWANKDLMESDRRKGLSEEQIMKNIQSGRYVLSIQYAEPHRDPNNNKIRIENYQLYKEECNILGAYEAGKFLKQGKYNLNEQEKQIVSLIMEKDSLNLYRLVTHLSDEETRRLKEINEILASSNWDFHKTEAVKYWQKAHEANNRG